MLFKNDVAYVINDDSDNLPKILAFTSTPANGDSIYVIHRGIGTFSRTPTSVVQLVLHNFQHH